MRTDRSLTNLERTDAAEVDGRRRRRCSSFGQHWWFVKTYRSPSASPGCRTDNVGSSLGRSSVLRLLRDAVHRLCSIIPSTLSTSCLLIVCPSFYVVASLYFLGSCKMNLREPFIQSIPDIWQQIVLLPYQRTSVTAPATTVHWTSVAKYACPVCNITNQLSWKIIWLSYWPMTHDISQHNMTITIY